MNKMFKYYVGLGAIGLFTVVLLIITIVQGASAKQDNATKKKASEISKALNSYISTNKKIPASLDEANIKDIPSSITYKKDSDTEYTFCATYKEAYSYGSASASSLISGSALKQNSSTSLANDYYGDSYTSTYKASTLYPTYSYKKGENCQTIKPYIYSSTSYPSSYSSSSSSSNIQASARDTQRRTDINAIHGKLEEYYNNNNGYPLTFTATTLSGIDSAALKDPNGATIAMSKAVTSESAALAVTSPSATGVNYLYVPFSCSGTLCNGYVLKSFIEVPTASYPNPYTKKGLNN